MGGFYAHLLDYDSEPEPEAESLVTFEPVYFSDQDNNEVHLSNILFDFEMTYNVPPESDTDGDIDLDNEDLYVVETKTIRKFHQCDRDWIIGGNEAHIKAKVSQILDLLDVPPYTDIISPLTQNILDLESLHEVKEIHIDLNFIVKCFPMDDDDYDYDGGDDGNVGGGDDVRLAAAPASEEAVEQHLETVVVEKEGYCVICMDKIRVGSDVETGRMPCMHVFHRTCGETWLRSSGSCPTCRAVFPP
ncbi:hypothetical protein AALP_AA3G114700 [Arabis alpina]|uniref:RING-type E3 ubiquitin transferase n=1 Tax=Arabis alpina TaxID=50452 RepID=A0A087H8J6_ARAAL|nr:hypothetical protein AALP_AA3G114700 [Arabis alpina]